MSSTPAGSLFAFPSHTHPSPRTSGQFSKEDWAIYDLLKDAEKVYEEAYRVRAERKKKEEFEKWYGLAKETVQSFEIEVIEVPDNPDFLKVLQRGDSPSDVKAASLGDKKFILVGTEDPDKDMGTVFGLFHEAAHLMVDKWAEDETKGVAQMELCLAKQTGDELFDLLRIKHRDEYGWDMPYERQKRTNEWKRGAQLAVDILRDSGVELRKGVLRAGF